MQLSRQQAAELPVAKKKPIVVIVDDSPTSISLYEISASDLDIQLETFQSPSDFLAYNATHDADLVFLDIVMREMDGLTVLKNLKERDPAMKTTVVVVTSKDYAQDRYVAKQLGAREFLTKPISSRQIRETICKYTESNSPAGARPDQ